MTLILKSYKNRKRKCCDAIANFFQYQCDQNCMGANHKSPIKSLHCLPKGKINSIESEHRIMLEIVHTGTLSNVLSNAKFNSNQIDKEPNRLQCDTCSNLLDLPLDCIRIIYDFYGGTFYAWNGLDFFIREFECGLCRREVTPNCINSFFIDAEKIQSEVSSSENISINHTCRVDIHSFNKGPSFSSDESEWTPTQKSIHEFTNKFTKGMHVNYVTNFEEEWDKSCCIASIHLLRFALVSPSFYYVYKNYSPIFQLVRNGYSNHYHITQRLLNINASTCLQQWILELMHFVADNQVEIVTSMLSREMSLNSSQFSFWVSNYFRSVLDLCSFSCIHILLSTFGQVRDSVNYKNIFSDWIRGINDRINLFSGMHNRGLDFIVQLRGLQFTKAAVEDKQLQMALSILLPIEITQDYSSVHTDARKPTRATSSMDFEPYKVMSDDEIEYIQSRMTSSRKTSTHYDMWKLYCSASEQDTINKETTSVINIFQERIDDPHEYLHSTTTNKLKQTTLNPSAEHILHTEAIESLNFHSVPEELIPKLLFEYDYRSTTSEEISQLQEVCLVDDSWGFGGRNWNEIERCLACWIHNVVLQYNIKMHIRTLQLYMKKCRSLIQRIARDGLTGELSV